MKFDINNLNTKEKEQSVINDYNDIAKEYCEEFSNTEIYNRYIDKFLDNVQSGKILDAGCGCGNQCEFINKHLNFESIGIDFSDKMLEEAKKRFPNVKVSKMNMTDLSFSDSVFNGLLSNCSLIHVPSELIPKTIKEFGRVLKPNGKLLLIILEGDGEEMVEEPYRKDTYVYTKKFREHEIIQILNENGFKVDILEKRKTESENELSFNELIIYATNIKK